MKAIDYTQLYLMGWLALGGIFHILVQIAKYKTTKEKAKGKWSLKVWWRDNFLTTFLGALASVILFGLTTKAGFSYSENEAFTLGYFGDSAVKNLLASVKTSGTLKIK